MGPLVAPFIALAIIAILFWYIFSRDFMPPVDFAIARRFSFWLIAISLLLVFWAPAFSLVLMDGVRRRLMPPNPNDWTVGNEWTLMFGSFAVVGVCFGIAIYLFVKLLAEKSSHHDAMTGLVTTIVTFVWSWMGLNLMTVSGRRLRIRGRDRMAKTQNGEGWTKNLIIHELLARPDRRLLAEAWAQNARAEHASIAAFSRLSLQLMALGAPPYLLAMTHQAALDEVRHAESAFSLASLLAGTPIRPAPFPDILIDQSGTVERVTLAIDSLTDGCIGEGIAARTLKLAAERVASPALHQVLKRTAEDEAQHQLLAWEIVTWLMGSSPEIRRALEAAIHRQSSLAPSPDQLASDLDAELCALMGRLPPEEEQTLRDDIIEEARHRLGSACLPTASALV